MNKHYFLFFFIAALFAGCTKDGELLKKPTFSNLNIKFIGSQLYQAVLNDKIIGDSLSSNKPLNQFVELMDNQKLTIKIIETGTTVVDTLIALTHTPSPRFLILETDPNSKPLFLSADNLATTPPGGDSLKVNLFNADTTHTKGKIVDIAIYQYVGGQYNLKGEIKNVANGDFSGYVQLPSNIGSFFMEIIDSSNGDIIVTKESRAGRLARPGSYRTNNVFSLLLKGNPNIISYSTSILLEQKL
ncbi:hypothetical protein [Desertivirga xinjiangensis]|uniref:hypothetical protein n=1 Tax=Desertivirga xinjiangensis TaxID=539206 RepID=UPI00210E5F54|nr:hypothetical protein [Pedobacter xinjiangensis]